MKLFNDKRLWAVCPRTRAAVWLAAIGSATIARLWYSAQLWLGDRERH